MENGLNQAKQLHILALTNVSPSKEDIEFSKDDPKMYKKQTNRYLKNKSTPAPVLISTVNGTVYLADSKHLEELTTSQK